MKEENWATEKLTQESKIEFLLAQRASWNFVVFFFKGVKEFEKDCRETVRQLKFPNI